MADDTPRATTRPPATPHVRPAALEPIALTHRLRDFDQFPVSALIRQADRRLYAECRAEQARCREFAERHVWPFAEQWDQRIGQDHELVAWPTIDAGVEYGMLSSAIPPMFGGRGLSSLALAVHAEELAAADAGVFVLFGAHELAMSSLAASLNPGILYRVLSEVADGERRGKAVLLALAHTEPTAGSDVEDGEDLRKARIGSRYTRVDGGYRLDARKVFISNGSIARYCVFTAFGDPRRPVETGMEFVVPNDAPGFSVGRVERKLGQRLCPAAEVIADGVFVPEEGAVELDDAARMIDTVLSITRGPVGAMSTGIARGALERTLKYLAQRRSGGRWLFEEQWVQLALADMFGRIQASRGLYLDAALAFEHWGFGRVARAERLPVPQVIARSRFFENMISTRRAAERMREAYARSVPKAELQRCVGIASTAKFMCSDAAVEVCMKAMEILGEDANDPQWGVEKCLRDAKLAQIFEGTNQLNRLHVTRGLLQVPVTRKL